MVFASITFLYYFLPMFLILYFVVPKKYKNIVLLIFSIIFYFYGEPKYILLMLVEVLFSYFMTLSLEKNKSKSLLGVIISFHIFLLCVFKYFNFIITNINSIFDGNISLLNIVLPIGISFYTFQIISYEVDVYRGKVKASKSLIDYMTYVFLFPQLIAGPIVRYETVSKELKSRKVTLEDFSYGVNRFIIGLFKKVVIANNIGELCNILNSSSEVSVLLYWVLGISYMLQIYFDFSGYSDIAIGIGRMIGFKFPENFNYPYTANSVTDFWRRWHMTLSSWFRDYVYIPLGGNRVSTLKHIRNILVVWMLTGLWHGASWNFIIWGIYFGVILLIEKYYLNKVLEKLPRVIRNIYAMFIVMISFIIFSSDDISSALVAIKGLFSFSSLKLSNDFIIYYIRSYGVILIGGLMLCTPLIKNVINKLRENKILNYIINIFEVIVLVLIFVIITSMLIDSSYNPFLYFRF